MVNNEGLGDVSERQKPTLDRRLVDKGMDLQRQLVFSDQDFTAHLEVLTIVHLAHVEGEGLSTAEVSRLRKMIGLQLRGLATDRRTAGNARFWDEVKTWAGPEIEKAATFNEELSDMPKSWRPAQNSLTRLQEALKTQRGEK